MSGEDLIVGFPDARRAFLKRQAEDPANRAIVTDALRQLTGGRWRLSYELREELDDAEASGLGVEAYTEEEWVARLKAGARRRGDAGRVRAGVRPNSAQKGE